MYKFLKHSIVLVFSVLVLSSVLYFNPQLYQKEISRPVSEANFFEKCLYPTVKVCDKEGTSGGSGFITRSTLVNGKFYNVVLCAAHVISPIEQIKIVVAKYKDFCDTDCETAYDGVVYAVNTDRDLAIICFISSEQMPVVELDFKPITHFNTPVFRIGYGNLESARIDYGFITQNSNKEAINLIRTNVFTVMGDSGGPLFLSSNNKVIGVAHKIKTLKNTLLPNISYYVPIDSFFDWNCEMQQAFDFVYDSKADFPLTPYEKIKLKDYF